MLRANEPCDLINPPSPQQPPRPQGLRDILRTTHNNTTHTLLMYNYTYMPSTITTSQDFLNADKQTNKQAALYTVPSPDEGQVSQFRFLQRQ